MTLSVWWFLDFGNVRGGEKRCHGSGRRSMCFVGRGEESGPALSTDARAIQSSYWQPENPDFFLLTTLWMDFNDQQALAKH